MLQNDVIKYCKMMSSNVALLHSNNCCVLEPAICEDLDLHVVIFFLLTVFYYLNILTNGSSTYLAHIFTLHSLKIRKFISNSLTPSI